MCERAYAKLGAAVTPGKVNCPLRGQQCGKFFSFYFVGFMEGGDRGEKKKGKNEVFLVSQAAAVCPLVWL